MFPHVLEIYVVWHPDDAPGAGVFQTFLAHFQGSAYSGLLSGTIAVFARSTAFAAGPTPRPIPLPGEAAPANVAPAQYVAVVPVLGDGLARALRDQGSPWQDYLNRILETSTRHGDRCLVFPLLLDMTPSAKALVHDRLPTLQSLDTRRSLENDLLDAPTMCRSLAQGLAQAIDPSASGRITVFISHTTRPGREEEGLAALIDLVRRSIADTRLDSFFDAQDLQPGKDWDTALRSQAGTAALLAVRSDLYSSREWCQREMLVAKHAGMPVVVLDALARREDRGSFLMDHVPRIPVRRTASGPDGADVRRALDLLVDKCLERALWLAQRGADAQAGAPDIDWWSSRAPEPVTIVEWLSQRPARVPGGRTARSLVVVHPDPPLGAEERKSLEQIVRMSSPHRTLDLLTPRTLAARAATPSASRSTRLPPAALSGKCLAISVSESEDLERLGFVEDHFRLALAEIARVILVSGGSLAYGGHLAPLGYTRFLVTELDKYCTPTQSLTICLPWTEHAHVPEDELRKAERGLGINANVLRLGIDGEPIDDQPDCPPPLDAATSARALTGMRNHMARCYDGRVLIGGKRRGFQGAMPGIVEEALLTAEARKPLYLVGGFGGAALDLVRCLFPELDSFAGTPDRSATPDPKVAPALSRFRSTVSGRGGLRLHNGLTREENLRLAATHRPGEIAELVGAGLGRIRKRQSQ